MNEMRKLMESVGGAFAEDTPTNEGNFLDRIKGGFKKDADTISLPQPGQKQTIDVNGVEVELDPTETYIGYAWTDSSGRERYEEAGVGDDWPWGVNNMAELKKKIAFEIDETGKVGLPEDADEFEPKHLPERASNEHTDSDLEDELDQADWVQPGWGDDEDELTESMDTEEIADELMQIADEIEGLVDQALRLVRESGRMDSYHRARSYWYGHIMAAVGSSGYTSMASIRDTAEELMEDQDEEEDF